MYKNKNVFISGAAKGFGLALAWNFAGHGARVFVSARRIPDAEKACAAIRSSLPEANLVPLQCDLTKPEDIRQTAARIKEQTTSLDILVNNGSMWLQQENFIDTPDEAIVEVINSGVAGPVLLTKHLLPLLQASEAADIVNIVSKCAESGFLAPGPHEAFYAMKHGHAGFADILRKRLSGFDVRVISLYPPDFQNTSPFDPEWGKVHADENKRLLNAKSLIDTINFALSQPRSCYISKIHFEGNRGQDAA